jgi:hypothetical protein
MSEKTGQHQKGSQQDEPFSLPVAAGRWPGHGKGTSLFRPVSGLPCGYPARR